MGRAWEESSSPSLTWGSPRLRIESYKDSSFRRSNSRPGRRTLPTPTIADDWDRAMKRGKNSEGENKEGKKLSIYGAYFNKIKRELKQLLRGKIRSKRGGGFAIN